MKKFLLAIVIGLMAVFTVNAQFNFLGEKSSSSSATMDFRNRSDYTMTLRIVHAGGGYYSSVPLSPHSSSRVSFSKSGSFKLKIKARSPYGGVSYHDGGKFSVTCTSREYSQGEMTFQMSSYGSGLGPSISAQQFESNY